IVDAAGIKRVPLPARSPNLNAYAERWVRSIKEECLSRLILFGEASLRHALTQYLEHFHSERNHQGKGNSLLFPVVSQDTERQSPSPAVVSAQAPRLGNLLAQAAAQSADLVLIDSAPNADAASLAAARVADVILIPCRPAAFDLDAIGTTLALAAVANKPAWVLLNAVPPQGRLGEEAAGALTEGGVQVVPLALHQLVAF